jgi:predicted glycosyltransferase involved in capsule biosynthesis
MAEWQGLWRNVIDSGMSRVIITECHELLWRNVRSYHDIMSGVIMAECQDLL